MTQEQLASELGVVRAIIANIETGRNKVDVERLLKIEEICKGQNKDGN